MYALNSLVAQYLLNAIYRQTYRTICKSRGRAIFSEHLVCINFDVQVSLYQNMKVAKSKKSSLSKKNNSPSFDQRFEFKVL